jgi:ribosomal protein L30E
MVEKAAGKGFFSRAAKAPVKAPEGLAGLVEAGLRDRIKASLGLAAKAGDLVTGFDKVREVVRAREVAVLIEAADGAEDGRDKIFALAHGVGAEVVVLGAFAGQELDLALGRPNVIHAAVRPVPLAEKLRVEMGRLAGFGPLTPSGWRLPGGPAEARQSGAA